MPGVRVVGSFDELASAVFQGETNAICWERELCGDFGEVVRELEVGRGITSIDDEQLLGLTLSVAGQVARETLLADLNRLRELGLVPSLDCVNGYVNEPDPGPVRTDVQSWHVDSATVEADTWLCTYHGVPSEGLAIGEAVRRVDVRETRAQLLELYGGDEGEGFNEFLSENFFDLHFVPTKEARAYSFGMGNLWRVATEHPDGRVPACVHRAPATVAGGTPRLLLIC